MKINKKDGSNKDIELIFINKDEYDEFLKILNSNILHLNKNKNFNLSSEKKMIKIFESANMTNNTIAANYFELVDSIEINNKNEIIAFSKLTNKEVIEIKKVMNLDGEELNFKVTPMGVETVKGNLCIVFSYFPQSVEIGDEINYYTRINSLVFSMGVASEYLFLKGSIDDAYMWDKRFKSNLFSLSRPKRNVKIPARRWL